MDNITLAIDQNKYDAIEDVLETALLEWAMDHLPEYMQKDIVHHPEHLSGLDQNGWPQCPPAYALAALRQAKKP